MEFTIQLITTKCYQLNISNLIMEPSCWNVNQRFKNYYQESIWSISYTKITV